MPFTMGAFTLGALSMIGLPPLGGFISKWYLVLGSIEAKQIPIIIVLATSTILNACYFLPVVYAAFFKEANPEKHEGIKEAPAFVVVPLVLTAIGAIVLFFAPGIFLELTRMVVSDVTGGN
jgi:multicomponent Na+:H+ antiporter subunit D